jgi:hypothetical protein
MTRSELLKLARLGADSRIAELQREIDGIRRRFNLGRGSSSARGRRGPKAAATGSAPRTRKMSAAGRKRIGDAARKRWAAWRKAHQKSKA